MRTSKILEMAAANLKQRKLRTSLTTLGVVIGITAIVGIASLGEGLRIDVNQRMQAGFELNVLIVFPGSLASGLGEPFVPQEVENISSLANVKLATGMMTLTSAEVYRNDSEQVPALSVGAINFSDMREMLPQRFRIAAGDFPAEESNDTIVFGYKAGTRNGTAIADIGEEVILTVILNYGGYSLNLNRTLRVAGILEEGGTVGLTNFDYWAFISTKTANEIYGREYYQFILVQLNDIEKAAQTAEDIEGIFKAYRISVFVPSSFMRQVDNILSLIQIFLTAIGSISLLVAGIGIMNIMTVSVMERTREVGILKAIGAKSRTVLSMFLAEAVVIGVVGGIIGIITGYGVSYGLAMMLSGFMQSQHQDTLFPTPETNPLIITPMFTPEWTIAALAFAIVICVIFGLYPARKASRLNPVEALRYE